MSFTLLLSFSTSPAGFLLYSVDVRWAGQDYTYDQSQDERDKYEDDQ